MKISLLSAANYSDTIRCGTFNEIIRMVLWRKSYVVILIRNLNSLAALAKSLAKS